MYVIQVTTELRCRDGPPMSAKTLSVALNGDPRLKNENKSSWLRVHS